MAAYRRTRYRSRLAWSESWQPTGAELHSSVLANRVLNLAIFYGVSVLFVCACADIRPLWDYYYITLCWCVTNTQLRTTKVFSVNTIAPVDLRADQLTRIGMTVRKSADQWSLHCLQQRGAWPVIQTDRQTDSLCYHCYGVMGTKQQGVDVIMALLTDVTI